MVGRARALGVLTGASIPAGLYLLYVFHYSVNVPFTDDWSIVSLSASALRGQLTLSDLWTPYGKSGTRLFVPKLLFVTFTYVDHLNIKFILFFSAVLLVVSYVLLLSLVRSYLAKGLSSLLAFSIGVVWFSLADEQNALWGFQLAWYLATFFFVVMVWCLLTTHRHRTIFFALGIVAAIAGSYSIIQGFALWPVGLICLLWTSPWGRRTYFEAAAWVSAAILTAGIYLPGYSPGTGVVCLPHVPSCGLLSNLLHPVQLLQYLVSLLANVIPPTAQSQLHLSQIAYDVLGSVLFVAALFVVVQSVRKRIFGESPLPLLLIMFGVLFDVMIALGRLGRGPGDALNQDRYTMPNLIVLVGIVLYSFSHLQALREVHGPRDLRAKLRVVGFVLVGGFLLIQCGLTTDSGIRIGRITHQTREFDARIVVNLDRIPVAVRGCDLSVAVWPPFSPNVLEYFAGPLRGEAARYELSVFQPSSKRHYRSEGPPTLAQCVVKRPTTS